MTKPLIQPLVNLNGTTRRALCEQQHEVLRALDDVIEAMSKAMPHGRDYQPDPPKFSEAREAWEQRLKLVTLLRAELQIHAMKMHEPLFDEKH